MHENDRVVIADARDGFSQSLREIERLAFPVARQILTAALDGAVFANHPGTPHADEGRKHQAVLLSALDQAFQKFDQVLDRILAFRIVIAVAP